jgi:hypothetical protein
VNHYLEHTGYDLGANILGHLHPFRLLHAALSNHKARVRTDERSRVEP